MEARGSWDAVATRASTVEAEDRVHAAALRPAGTITSTHGRSLQVRVKHTGVLRATAAYVYKAPPWKLPLSLLLPLHPPQLFLIYTHYYTFFFDTTSHSYWFYCSPPGSAASTIALAALVARRQRPARPALQLTAAELRLTTVGASSTRKLSSTKATALPPPGFANSSKPQQAQALSYCNFRRSSTSPAPTAPSPIHLPRSFSDNLLTLTSGKEKSRVQISRKASETSGESRLDLHQLLGRASLPSLPFSGNLYNISSVQN
ncbi:hypothetical protein PSPO01_11305 [Paraphaeosphaeria sporulosa]